MPSDILVVDDDIDIRESLRDVLEDLGYSVVTAEHGRAALDLLQAGERPRVILLDLMMPVMTGWELQQQVQNDPGLADIPVIVISATGTPSEPQALGAVEFLGKPIALERLIEAVRRHGGAPPQLPRVAQQVH